MSDFHEIFDHKKIKEIIKKGGFYCHSCLIAKQKEFQSKEDPKYCQSCYDYIQSEKNIKSEESKVRKESALKFITANPEYITAVNDGHYAVVEPKTGKRIVDEKDLPVKQNGTISLRDLVKIMGIDYSKHVVYFRTFLKELFPEHQGMKQWAFTPEMVTLVKEKLNRTEKGGIGKKKN